MKLRCTKKWCKLFSVLLVMLFAFQIAASAEGPYINYTYDSYTTDEAIPTAAGYLPESLISGDTLGVGSLKNPQDLYYDNQNYLYILDSGNNRIVVLNKSLQLDHIVSPTDASGNALAFQDAKGMFVDNTGKIYVADEAAKFIYILDSKGAQLNSIGAPESDIIPSGFDYKPCKVLVDNSGIIYVISDGCFSGALQFSPDYKFMGFYGSEPVTLTAQLVIAKIWDKILPKSMSDKQIRAVPVNYNNFDIDSQGFIYTCKKDTDSRVGQVRKLNYFGTNILWYKTTYNSRTYGDIKTYYDNKEGDFNTILSDVDVDYDGFINVLDTRRMRVFQYDQDSNLLFIFGGKDEQFGYFKAAAAIESVNGKILVLDADRANITVMGTTYFADQVHAASLLYKNGNYVEAEDMWKDVLKYDSNFSLANIGLGKAYQTQGKYNESLKYFKLANDSTDYSDSYYHYRSDILHVAFPYIMLGIVAIIIVPMILSAVFKKRRKNEYEINISAYRYPFYVMKHPFKGYTELKDDKRGNLFIAHAIVLLFFIVGIFARQNTGFLFTKSRPEDFNILYTAVGTVGIFLLWVVSNWALSTLMDGEGKFTEIWAFSAYALLPYVLFMIPLTLISNALTLEESAFFTIAQVFVFAWVGICMFMAVREVHQFSTGKTVVAILGTLLGMLIMAGIYAIVYSMFTQLVAFIGTLVNEVILRL